MARRFSTTTRVLTAASALALAGVLSACHPPNQKPADMGNAENTLPSYSEPAAAEAEGSEAADTEESASATTVTVTETQTAEATPAEAPVAGEAAAGVSTAAPTSPAQ